MRSEYDFLIYKSGSTYYAKSGATGLEVYSNASCALVIQYASDQLTSGGIIEFKKPNTTNDPIPLTSGITFKPGISIKGNGIRFDVSAVNGTVFYFNYAGAAGASSELITRIENIYAYDPSHDADNLLIRFRSIRRGGVISNIVSNGVYNVIKIEGESYDTLVEAVTGMGCGGIFIDIEPYDIYNPTGPHIHACEHSTQTGTTAIGVKVGALIQDATISDSWFEDVKYPIWNEGTFTKIIGCLLTSTSGDCIYDIGLYTNIIGNNIGGGCGIRLIGGTDQYTEIVGNVFRYNGPCITGDTSVDNKFVMIDSNLFWLGDEIGISGRLSNCIISNNIFRNNGTVHGTGIYFATYGADCIVTGNIFDSLSRAINIAGSVEIVISDNKIISCTNPPIIPSTAKVNDNYGTGIIYKNAGTLQFTAATTLVVTHGLSVTPTKVIVTGSDANSNALWITSIGATTFTVNRGNSTGTPWIYWYAEV